MDDFNINIVSGDSDSHSLQFPFTHPIGVKFKKLRENAVIPTKGSAEAACYDLYAALDTDELTIWPHDTEKVGLGLAIAVPAGYFGAIFARSGLATKQGLRPANAVGVIDADYRGEWIVALHNDTDELKIIKNGDRIAQMCILPTYELEFHEVEELDDTARGAGGFGHTGAR